MRFTVDRNQILGALESVQSVVERKSTSRILENLLLTATDGQISVAGTNLEVGFEHSAQAQVEASGRITVSARHLHDIVKELPEKPIQFWCKPNHWVEVLSGKIRFNIVSLPPDEYPLLPNFPDRDYRTIAADLLADMIDKTDFAISNDTTRFQLNGVYLEKLDGPLFRMTGTDGHRLSFVDQAFFQDPPELKKGVIIPQKGLNELRKMIGHAKGEVRLALERSHLFCRTESSYLFVRLIEGEFPDYKQVIPRSSERTAIISRTDFLSALRRVSLLAHEKSRAVRLSFQEGLLTISSSNPDMGEAREEIDVHYSQDPIDVGFNCNYLLECLPAIASKEIELRFKDRVSPGVVQGLDQRNHSYVIMPMRI